MLSVTCLTCKKHGQVTILHSGLLGATPETEMNTIGQKLVQHMQMSHAVLFQQAVALSPIFNGFQLLKHFSSENLTYSGELASMRALLVETIMETFTSDEIAKMVKDKLGTDISLDIEDVPDELDSVQD